MLRHLRMGMLLAPLGLSGGLGCGPNHCGEQGQFQQFNSARLQTISQANFFSAVDGTDGTVPKDPTGGTWVFFFQNGAPSANLLQVGVVGVRGYSICITGQVPQFIPQGGTAVSTTSTAISSNMIGLALTITGGNVRTSTNGYAVTTHSVGTITPANAGDTLRVCSTLDTTSVPNRFYCAAFIPSVLADSDLQALSNIVNNDNRFDYSAVLAFSPSIFFTALDDWNGSSSSFTTRGSSPITLHKNGTIARFAFTEVRRTLAASEIADGGVEEISSGSGINVYKRHGSYATQTWTVADTQIEADVISGPTGGVGTSNLGIYKDLNFATPFGEVGAGSGLLGDNQRHVYFLATTNGHTYTFVDGGYPDQTKQNYAVQAIRYELTKAPTYVAPSTPLFALAWYGDSISIGVAASAASAAAFRIVRAACQQLGGRASLEAFGGRALLIHDTDPQAWAQRMFSLATRGGAKVRYYVIAIGTNDLAANQTTFATQYAANLDALIALDPGARILLVSPFYPTTTGDGANSPTMRANIFNIAHARPANCWYLDGRTAVSQSNITVGVHPNTAGQAQYAAKVLAWLLTNDAGLRRRVPPLGLFPPLQMSGPFGQ